MTAEAAGLQDVADARLLRLGTLLQIEADLRAADGRDEIQFIAANETHRLLPYDQAVVWRRSRTGRPGVSAISGVPTPDHNAPFVVWANKLVRAAARGSDAARPAPLDPASLPADVRDGWAEWSPGAAFWCPFPDRRGRFAAGMVMFRAAPFGEAERAMAERLSGAYGFAWWALDPRAASVRRPQGGIGWRIARLAALAAVVAAMFVPVRQSALAPAEVTARDPLIVTAPVAGVIETMHAPPNAPVEEGALLFSLDKTTLRNRATLAEKALAVAEADLRRAGHMVFADPRSKAEIALLVAEADEKRAELNYTRDLLDRADVRAGRAGIAIYGDPSDWIGKPVTVGEKVMAVADPAAAEVTLFVPVADAISLEPGAEVLLFLDTDPLHPRRARLTRAAYEAEVTPGDVLAYRARAALEDGAAPPRIGLKGTAKVHGEEVALFFYLMRRPIAALRRTLGF